MIVITRNGRTTVYQGWRAWLIGAVATVAVFLVLAATAVLMLGLALSVGMLILLLVPALIVVAAISRLLGPR